MIYMRGLKAEALVAMVDFLYYGEANINQENLDTFLCLAEELRLKGLTGSSAESNHEEESKNNQSNLERVLEKENLKPKQLKL